MKKAFEAPEFEIRMIATERIATDDDNTTEDLSFDFSD